MAASTYPLSQLQAWMQSVLMHPGGTVEGIAGSPAQQHLAIAASDLESVVTRSRQLSAMDRLEIYARAYYARLLECLRSEFPVLAKAMGEDCFDDFAIDYLQRYPSQSYTLSELGARFAQFLEETRPPAADGDPIDWPELLIDLTRLEWTFNEVFDGPGVENQRLLDPDSLRVIPPAQWSKIRLIPVPCLRLLCFRFPVHRYYRALRDDDDVVPPAAATTFLAVTRRDFICRHCELDQDEFELLSLLVSGEKLERAIASAARKQPSAEADSFSDRLHQWFRRWSAEGFFLRVDDLGEEWTLI